MQEVLYDATLRYLLVVLPDMEACRRTFLALRPNAAQLLAAHTGGELMGVVVTIAGVRQRAGLQGLSRRGPRLHVAR